MELRHLRYFVVVAEELHFARAAEKLKITQPALSRQIAALEKELNTKLISRSNKWKITLTESGKLFLQEAYKILANTERAVNIAKCTGYGGYGHLAVGAISSTIENPAFVQTVLEMRRRYPHLIMEVVDATSDTLPDQVRQRNLDIAFMRSQVTLNEDDDSLICEYLWSDPLVLAIPHDSVFARIPEVAVDSLKDQSFIMVPERTSSSLRKFLDVFFRKYGGFSPRVDMEIYNTYTALRMVAGKLGVAVVADSYRGMFSDKVCYRYFKDATPEIPLFVIRPADNASKMADVFLEILLKRYNKLHSQPI